MELKGKRIAFLGDSITQGVRVVETENIYVNRIASETGAICLNYGVSGTRIGRSQVPSPWGPVEDEYFGLRAERMEPDVDLVVIFGGTNDFGNPEAAPVGTMSDRTVDSFYGALHDLYRLLTQRYPGKPIVFLTPLHRCRAGEEAKEPRLELFVEAIRDVTAFYGLPLLDLYRDSAIHPDTPDYVARFMPDGLHPNDAGHEILARELLELLRKL